MQTASQPRFTIAARLVPRVCPAVKRAGWALLVMLSLPAIAARAQEPVFSPGVPPFTEPVYPAWEWQILPDSLLWHSYLAGTKEPRFGYAWLYDTYDSSWVNDATIGGRVGLARWGTHDPFEPAGWQLDLEGAVFPRLDGSHELDLISADYRVGIPLTWRDGPYQAKLAYYHVSSHAGDEYLLRNPGFQRINYRRDALVLGGGWLPDPSLRLYAELGYAFVTDGGAEPWEMQFGWELAPPHATGTRGAPFVAMNAYLREEVDWGGEFTVMAGWAWRGKRLLRAGVQYSVGETSQWQFLGRSEQLIGLGVWYDY